MPKILLLCNESKLFSATCVEPAVTEWLKKFISGHRVVFNPSSYFMSETVER